MTFSIHSIQRLSGEELFLQLEESLTKNLDAVKLLFIYLSKNTCTPEIARFIKNNPNLENLYYNFAANVYLTTNPFDADKSAFALNVGSRKIIFTNKKLLCVPNLENDSPIPLWMKYAFGELNVSEYPGKASHNSRIIEYFGTTQNKTKDDETPWCSAFVSWCFTQANIPVSSLSAWSLSWNKWGTTVSKPIFGALAVIDWNGKNGHVGFIVGVPKKGINKVAILGGNQRFHNSNDKEGRTVNITTFNISKRMNFIIPPGYMPNSLDRLMFPIELESEEISSFSNTR